MLFLIVLPECYFYSSKLCFLGIWSLETGVASLTACERQPSPVQGFMRFLCAPGSWPLPARENSRQDLCTAASALPPCWLSQRPSPQPPHQATLCSHCQPAPPGPFCPKPMPQASTLYPQSVSSAPEFWLPLPCAPVSWWAPCGGTTADLCKKVTLHFTTRAVTPCPLLQPRCRAGSPAAAQAAAAGAGQPTKPSQLQPQRRASGHSLPISCCINAHGGGTVHLLLQGQLACRQ